MKGSRGSERAQPVTLGPSLGFPALPSAQWPGITNMFSESRCHCECLKNKSGAQEMRRMTIEMMCDLAASPVARMCSGVSRNMS